MIYIPFISQQNDNDKKLWLNKLNEQISCASIVLPEQLSEEERSNVTIVIVANPKIEALDHYPNLIWVQSLWAGVEKLVGELPEKVQLVRLIDPQLADTMAEAVLAWTLYLQRKMPAYAQQQRDKIWQQLPTKTAKETRISLLGSGELGIASLSRLNNFGYQLSYWSRTNKHLDGIKHYQGTSGLKQMLEYTDILICLLPLTPDTRYLLDHETLNYLPNGAQLINFSRGGVLDLSSLLSLLDNGKIEHAVLDVFEQEPLPPTAKVWHHKNITVLPHISAPTNVESACKIVEANISHYLNTNQLPVTVDRKKGY